MALPTELLAGIDRLKRRLDDARPLSSEVIAALRHVYDVELTYTSNAIEGNTLTHQETALVIEKGITVGGKSLAEHLEAQDHYAAVGYVRELADKHDKLGRRDALELHRRIVLRSRPEFAGVLSSLPRRIAGSGVAFPAAAKLPGLMDEFGLWIAAQPDTPAAAFEAHLRLVGIHPFSDGNGRAARLLMNLILIRGGYPPIAIRPSDRKRYIEAIEASQTGGDSGPYYVVLGERLADTLEDYLEKCREAEAAARSAKSP